MQRWDGMQVSCTGHVQGSERLQINIRLGTRNLQDLKNYKTWLMYGDENWVWSGRKQIMHYALESYNYIFRWKIITFWGHS